MVVYEVEQHVKSKAQMWRPVKIPLNSIPTRAVAEDDIRGGEAHGSDL